MPRVRYTPKQRLIKACVDEFTTACCVALVRLELNLPVNIRQVEMYGLLLTHLFQNRYLQPRLRKPYSTDLMRVLVEYSEDDFKAIIRLSPDDLHILAELVSGQQGLTRVADEDDPLSHIKLQLTITLFRLGTKGISVKKVAWIFGVSEGSVHAYTWRCIDAIDHLAEQFIVWPDQAKKAEISRWFRKEKGFPNCIGAVDGVPFPFDMGPEYETNAWITRKHNFAMGATAVCDHMGRFTYASTGYVGSVHDSSAYKNSCLHRDKDQFFQGKEYLLADAAYALRPTVIPRYKNATGDQLQFNHLHGVARVKIEHAFGMLKLKFQSLQNLPIRIKTRRDIQKASRWIIACMVLHNFIRRNVQEELVDERVRRELEAHPRMDNPQAEEQEPDERHLGSERREKLKRWVLEHH